MEQNKIQKLYEVECVLSKKIRTTEKYWKYISETKHHDLKGKLDLALLSLSKANEVWQNNEHLNIYLYYKKFQTYWICVVVRILNGDGFIVTSYITTKSKRKGKKVWPKQ